MSRQKKLAAEYRCSRRKILRIGQQFRAQIDDPEGISVRRQQKGNCGPPEVALEVLEKSHLINPTVQEANDSKIGTFNTDSQNDSTLVFEWKGWNP